MNVGAQFIGAAPIHRPGVDGFGMDGTIVGTRANELAVRTINRRLRDIRFWSLPFIVGDGRDQSAHTDRERR